LKLCIIPQQNIDFTKQLVAVNKSWHVQNFTNKLSYYSIVFNLIYYEVLNKTMSNTAGL